MIEKASETAAGRNIMNVVTVEPPQDGGAVTLNGVKIGELITDTRETQFEAGRFVTYAHDWSVDSGPLGGNAFAILEGKPYSKESIGSRFCGFLDDVSRNIAINWRYGLGWTS